MTLLFWRFHNQIFLNNCWFCGRQKILLSITALAMRRSFTGFAGKLPSSYWNICLWYFWAKLVKTYAQDVSKNIPVYYRNNTNILVSYFWNTLYNDFAMIKMVFYNKNALNTIATMTSILWLTSIYYISQQDQLNAMYDLWPKRQLMCNTCCMHLYCYLLSCIVWKLEYSKFVSFHIHTFISRKRRNFYVLFLLHYLGSWIVRLWYNSKTNCSGYTHC